MIAVSDRLELPLDDEQRDYLLTTLGRIYPDATQREIIEALFGIYLQLNLQGSPADEIVPMSVNMFLLPYGTEKHCYMFFDVSEAKTTRKLCLQVLNNLIDRASSPEDILSTLPD